MGAQAGFAVVALTKRPFVHDGQVREDRADLYTRHSGQRRITHRPTYPGLC